MHNIWQDIRIALRSFRRTPIFTIAAVGCLGLGLGINTAVFSFFYGILIRPLPFEDPNHLTILFENKPPEVSRVGPSFPDYTDWRARNRSFSDMAIYGRTIQTMRGIRHAERLKGARISHNLFDVLGIQPIRGRVFNEMEDQPGAPATVILSHRFWQTQLGGDPQAIGRNVTLGEEIHTVIGIMPRRFNFPEEADFWVPLRLSPVSARDNRNLAAVVGHLLPGVTLEQAQSEMAGIALQLAEQHPESNTDVGVVVRSLADDFLWGRRTPAIIFYGAVSLLLLLACANVAHLMLTRASARRREVAIRTALGASRYRLVRQLLIESVTISMAAGALGLLLGILGRDFYLASIPEQFPFYLRFEINLPVILSITGIALLTGLLFGLAPLSISIRNDLSPVLRGGTMTVSDHPRMNWVRSILIVTESCIALIVLIGAGLLLKSLVNLRAVEPGFNPDRILTMEVSLPQRMSELTEQTYSFFEMMRDRIVALPEVESVSTVSNLPMGRSQWQGPVSIERARGQVPEEVRWAIGRSIQSEYLETMEIPLLSGRRFDERDAIGGANPAMLINQSFADRYWPDGDCLGKYIKYGEPDSEWPWMEVVGVVGDLHHYGLDYPVVFGYYRPFSQVTFNKMTLVARTRSDPRQMAASIRSLIQALRSDVSVWDIRTMEEVIYENHWEPIVYSRLFMIFSTIALILAALGVYGIVSYSTVQRTREFGLRLALGAQTGALVRLALRRVIVLASFGLIGGLILAYIAMRLLSSMLFGVEYTDPGIYVAATAVMGTVALLAGYLPARRATRIDIVTSLHCD